MVVEPQSTKPALNLFQPRQVILRNHNNMKVKSSSETLTLELKKTKNRDSNRRGLLLKAIDSYLGGNGFSKTLSAFRSEAAFEIGGLKEPSLDLEDIFCKFLEAREYSVEVAIKDSKEDTQKLQIGEESTCDASEEPILKKKRKKSNGSDADTKPKSSNHGVENGSAKCANDSGEVENSLKDEIVKDESHLKSKEKKKKKSKLVIDSLGVSTEKDELETFKEAAEVHIKSKDKKKTENNLISDSLTEDIELVGSEKLQEVIKEKKKDLKSSLGISFDETNVKHKDKKRKKHESISKDIEITQNLNITDSKEGLSVSEENVANVESKGSKKRKRLISEESESQVETEITSNTLKLRKSEGLGQNKETEELPKPVKKRKAEKIQENSNKSQNIPRDEAVEVLTEVKENAIGNDGQKEKEQHVNGNLEKKGKELGCSPKIMKNGPNGSAEPKTSNAFRRVKVEEVKFVDERLQDNSYWAKDGAEMGYGAKAQEILGQVRGRDFRHEKTKKKRGSYRGGQIDLNSHSIKFQYSDGEE